MSKFKTGDKVMVITGKEKGKTGNIIEINEKNQTVIVEKLNIQKKHKKRDQQSPGKIIDQPGPIAISNIMQICPKTDKPTRVRYEYVKDKKVRKAVKSGEVIK